MPVYPSTSTLPSTTTVPGSSTAPFPIFAPDATYRHEYLSGIEVNQPVATTTVDASSFTKWTEFFLPVDIARAGGYVPDITGAQACIQTDETFPYPPFYVNFTLEFNQFGEWTQLAQGSVQKPPPYIGDKVWITAYFNKPVSLTTEQTEIQMRLGVDSHDPVWTNGGGDLAFRLLTASGDSGTDFLGNRYRGYVRRNSISNADTVGSTNTNSAWMSKPNPSKFAVESVYYDVSDGLGHARVTDRMLIDPITPGVYCTVYYSSDGDPGTDDADWEQKLWTPIFDNFKLDRRLDIPLPEPVTSKFIKVEFTHLQAQSYSPGTFHQPVTYKKHPKWVLAYFLARINAQNNTEDPVIARRVRVVYDALQLAYDYYLDDLHTGIEVPPSGGDISSFLNTPDTGLLDANTLAQVAVEMKPYYKQPGQRASQLDSMLAQYVTASATGPYPTEQITVTRADTTAVSSVDRMPVLIEQNMPVMFFYLTCRHAYKVLQAEFETGKAYFAGVREIAFTREHYTAASDQDMYVENLGDFTNVLRNDFLDEEYIPFNPNPAP